MLYMAWMVILCGHNIKKKKLWKLLICLTKVPFLWVLTFVVVAGPTSCMELLVHTGVGPHWTLPCGEMPDPHHIHWPSNLYCT